MQFVQEIVFYVIWNERYDQSKSVTFEFITIMLQLIKSLVLFC